VAGKSAKEPQDRAKTANGRAGRIALVAGALDATGATTYAENLVRGLTASGATVDLVASGGALAGRLTEAGATVGVFPRVGRPVSGLISNARAASRLAAFAPEVVHALSPGAWRAAAMLARKLGRPAVVTVHDFVDRPSGLPWPTGRWPFAIAPSEALRENLVNAGGMPKTRVTVVPMGLDLSRFVPPPETDDRELQTGVPRGPHEGATKVVGCIAPLHRGKGVGLFIGAAKRALDSHPDVEFVVSGSGPAEAELRGVAAKLGVRGRLTFLGGEVRAEELLRNLDVFVLPSPREAVGIPVLQAMASSKPVVAAGAGALFELVRDGETGFLVPPGDAKALAGKVTELLADKHRRVEMGRAGRELVEKEFALERMVKGTRSVYGRAAEGRGP